jgi:gamma-glutamyl-gamma-aminobutyrate hydrolase PuuD
MNPLVALTTTTRVPEGSHARRQEIALYALYISVLDEVGLTPVLITPAHSARSIRDLLENCSGLVLSGGEDVDPARYGETPLPELGRVNTARDEMEFAALAAAFERSIPILGICRGCQVLNVHMGGSLYQDIDTQHPGELMHRQREPWNSRTHEATIESGSQLARILGTERLCINSFHHQAIKNVAPGLRVTAHADDGLVEAVEANDQPWVIGVQWHPERHEATAPETDPDRLLFNDFRRAVVARAHQS